MRGLTDEQLEKIEAALDEAHLRLKDKRLEKGFTQKEVEKITGISQPLLSAYESGSRELSLRDVFTLCMVYECDASYILGDKPAALNVPLDENELSSALELEQLLTRPLGEFEQGITDTFIRLYIYKAIRTAYMSNPRHKSSRLFKVSDEQVSIALARSLDELENGLPRLLEGKPSVSKQIELPPDNSAALREFISKTEELISHTPMSL